MSTAFSIAYPSNRGLLGQVFRPIIEPRAYLRALHLLVMFPLGLAYFTFFVTAFATGGSFIWTFFGPPILLLAMFVSLWLGDLEASMVNHVSGVDIRRPPQALEGVTSFRQKVWTRIIDPSTWTGLIYEFAQFPIGIAGLVVVFTCFYVSGALIVAPLLVWQTDELTQVEEYLNITFNQPVDALPLVPLGLLAWLLTMHIVKVFSATHAAWARLMLGSRGQRIQATGSDGNEPPAPPSLPIALLPPGPVDPVAEVAAGPPEEAKEQGSVPAVFDPPPAIAPNPAVELLTAREREVVQLLARGYSNADICETCFISEGTVKTHVGNILAKLELRDRTQVVVFAYEAGLVRPGAWRSSGQAPAIALSR